MYDVPGDCFKAHNPNYLEYHYDTTDFEDTTIPALSPRYGNHRLFNQETVFSKFKDTFNLRRYDSQLSVKSKCNIRYESKQTYRENREIGKSYKNKTKLDSGDQIEIKSKRSLIRHKVIPCLSGMFKRSSNNVKQMSIIKENQAENANTDNGCQTCRVNSFRMRKFNRRQQCYALKPVYAVGGNVQAGPIPFQQTKIAQEVLTTSKILRKEYYNPMYTLTSSSDAERTESPEREDTGVWTSDRAIDTKDDWCATEKQSRNKKQQLGSSAFKWRRKMPFRVYANQGINIKIKPTVDTSTSPMSRSDISSVGSSLPQTCSGFWDYLLSKMNLKYQNQYAENFKSCNCPINMPGISPNTYQGVCNSCDRLPEALYYSAGPCESCENPASPARRNCSCNTSSIEGTPSLVATYINHQLPPNLPDMSLKMKGTPEKTDCKCRKATKPELIEPRTVKKKEEKRCQMPHDNLTNTLTQKYNGEILCIHNPPCVLINGCLKLPNPCEEPTKEEPCPATAMWPMLQSNRGFQHIFKRKRTKKFVEQSCQYEPEELLEEGSQYEPPLSDIQLFEVAHHSCQYYPDTVDESLVTEDKEKIEKIVQSLCNHEPPCELKRTCYNRHYIQNSKCYIAVNNTSPLNVLKTATDEATKSSGGKLRCASPVNNKNYVVLTAKEEAGTQVRMKAKIVCRHEPPCVMIPKCFAGVCTNGYIPYDAIQSCTHQPLCEMIPACCRKPAKAMVSVSSQHPNSCRLV